jgi:predicted MPP superfamily phosphohydrolase
VADESGYIDSNVMLKVGIGNRESFDVLDRKEMNRLLARIEQLGSFQMLDLIFNIHYNVSDKKKIRRVHGDEYFFRLTFHPGMFEILLHHRKGIRRIDSDEIIQLLLDKLNEELARNKYSLLEIQTIATS